MPSVGLSSPEPTYMRGYPLGSSAPAPLKGKAVLMWSRVSCPVSASKKYMLPLMVAYMASTRPSFCLAQSRMFIIRLVDSGQRTSSG